MADVEKLAQERRYILLLSVVSYGLWWGASVLQMTPWFTGGSHLLYIVSLVFALPWAVSVIWLVIWVFRVRTQPQAYAALNDEMTVRNRWRASRVSMAVLMVCLAVGLGLSGYVHISAALALGFLVWVLVVTKIGFYLWFDRSE